MGGIRMDEGKETNSKGETKKKTLATSSPARKKKKRRVKDKNLSSSTTSTKKKTRDRGDTCLEMLETDDLNAILTSVAEADAAELQLSQQNLDYLQDTVSGLSLSLDDDISEEYSAEPAPDSPGPALENTQESKSLPGSPSIRNRSSAIAAPFELNGRTRPSRITTTPPNRRFSRNRTSSGSINRSKRPDLNRDALSTVLPTPPTVTPGTPLKSAKTVEQLEAEKKEKDMRKAKEALRKKLLQESAMSNSTLYRARRCSVMHTGNIQPLSSSNRGGIIKKQK